MLHPPQAGVRAQPPSPLHSPLAILPAFEFELPWSFPMAWAVGASSEIGVLSVGSEPCESTI